MSVFQGAMDAAPSAMPIYRRSLLKLPVATSVMISLKIGVQFHIKDVSIASGA